MRFQRAEVIALMFMSACLRLGYDTHRVPSSSSHDAGQRDAGFDAAVADAGGRLDASAADASSLPRATADASSPRAGSGASDAALADDDGVPNDAAMPVSTDAGTTMDAAVSGVGPCPVTMTTNMYVGDPHYHGTLSLQNTGTSTWTTPTISFDLPSTNYVCNDARKLPGDGWSLQSSAGHCSYTKTAPSLSIAPGASLTFEYSTNDGLPESPAVTDLSVSGCP